MRTASCVFMICLLLCGSRAALAQDDKRVGLSPVAMAKIVRIVLRAEFKASSETKEIYLSERFVERAWLPIIEGISFTLVDKAEFKRRGKAYFFNEPVINNGLVHIDFGYGNDCTAWGTSYVFSVTGTSIHRIDDPVGRHWGTGCASANGEAKKP